MPGLSVKNLYLGKNVGDLNKLAGDFPKVDNPRIYIKSAEKLYKNAEENALLGDEERAYVFYMKFFNIVSAIKKTQEYKKNEQYYKDMIGMRKCIVAIGEAERLSGKLKERYEEKETQDVCEKFEGLKKEKKDNEAATVKELEAKRKEEEEVAAKESETAQGTISASKLYSLLMDNETNILVIDARPEKDYAASHISHNSCINIPAEIIPPGCTVSQIEKGMASTWKESWRSRGTVDFIALMDWNSTLDQLTPGSTLKSLKDALYKWDQETVLRSEPLVIEGGYDEWLHYYPTVTTNANIPRPQPCPAIITNTPSLDSIDYNLDSDILKTKEQLLAERQMKIAKMKKEAAEKAQWEADQQEKAALLAKNTTVSDKDNSKSVKPLNVPSVDRSKKPTANNLNNAPSSAPDTKPANLGTSKMNNLLYDSDVVKNSPVSKQEKNTNITKQGNVDIPLNPLAKELNVEEVVAAIPSVNRSLKPRDNSPSPTTSDRDGSQQDAHKKLANDSESSNSPLLSRKESDTNDTRPPAKSDQAVILEHQARVARLQKVREETDQLMAVKKQEAQETAQLMRTKKHVEQELRELEHQLHELSRKKKDQEELNEQTLVEESKNISKEKEAQEKKEEKEAKKRESEQIEKEKQAKQKADQLANEKERKELMDRIEREERERRARIEKERQDEERKRAAKEEERRIAEVKAERDAEAARKKKTEEDIKRPQEQRAVPSKVDRPQGTLHTPGLPVGWEKRLDAPTGRYYYINHRDKHTQWNPPTPVSAPKKVVEDNGGVYKTRLKDEGEQTAGGSLKRSRSTPNIAKMVGEEEANVQAIPQVTRVSKPKTENRDRVAMTINTDLPYFKLHNLSPVSGSVSRGLCGLRNIGNTCYLNSTIQCLSNTVPLSIYFLNDNYKHDINKENVFGKGGLIAEEYAVVIKALWSGQHRSVAPRDLWTVLGRFYSLFASHEHQDSQELLLFLLDGLHEDLNQVKKRPQLPEQKNDGVQDTLAARNAWEMHKKINRSVIVELFQGQFKSTVQCLSCRKMSVTFDVFVNLSLPLPHSSRCSLSDCLAMFSKEEKMSGECKWDCPQCRKKQDAVKKIALWKLPPVLVIQLKRFYYQGMSREKITSHVDFPLDELNMGRYTEGPNTAGPYSLYGVSNHYGSLDGGHYTASVKNPNNKRWYKYDDSDVSEMSKSDIKSSAAFILFYSSMDMGTLLK